MSSDTGAARSDMPGRSRGEPSGVGMSREGGARSSNRVILVGATGWVGCHAINSLVERIGAENVCVLTREPGSSDASKLKSKGVEVKEGGFDDQASMMEAFEGASAVFLITPGAEDRVELLMNGARAAKDASVPLSLIVSIPTVSDRSTIFGQQFHDIEEGVKSLDIPYAFLRLPMFTDNIFMFADQIRAEGKFYGAVTGSRSFTTVSLCHVGDAAAAILADPSRHINKCYTLACPAYTKNDLAAALTKALGRQIRYEQRPYDGMKSLFMSMGWPEWQVNGVLQLERKVDEGSYNYKGSDLRSLIGHEAYTIERWVEDNKYRFQ